VEPAILLSILDYEEELSKSISLEKSEHYYLIRSLLSLVQGIHIDLIRPPYSEELRFPDNLVEKLCMGFSDSTVELHIMAEDPIQTFKSVESSLRRTSNPTVSLHLESSKSDDETIADLKKVRLSGCRAGIVLDLRTPTSLLRTPIVENADFIQVMSVQAGEGGRKFDPASLSKIKRVRAKYPRMKLEVDGGIDEDSGRMCLEAGADVLIIGSRITRSPDPFSTVKSIKRKL